MNNLQAIFSVLLVAIIAPLILAWFTARTQRTVRLEDWKRQDALRAEEKADAEAKAAATEAQRNHVNERLDDITSHVEQVHLLVNGRLTAAIQAALDANLLLRVELWRTDQAHPSKASAAAVAAVDRAIDRLRGEIADRADAKEQQLAAMKLKGESELPE